MSNNFPILIETKEEAVGSVLRLLHKMPGIIGIHLQLEPPAKAAAENVRQLTQTKAPWDKERKPGSGIYNRGKERGPAGGIRKVIAAALMKSPLHANVLKPLLERNGYAAASFASAIGKMVEDKEAVRIASGTYRLTTKGEKTYTALGSQVSQYKSSGRIGLRPIILKEIEAAGHDGLEHVKLKELLVRNGYSDSNMYNMVPRLQEEGLISRREDTFFLLERGRKFLAEVNELEAVEQAVPALEHKTGENV